MQSVKKRYISTYDSLGELNYRFFLAKTSISLYYYFGLGLEEVDPLFLNETAEFQTRSILGAFAFIQISSVLDGSGIYSLNVQVQGKKNPQVSQKRLEKIFPILFKNEIKDLAQAIDEVLLKHKDTVKIILDVRHKKLAHMGKKVQQIRDGGKYSIYSLKSLIPKKFAYKRIILFSNEMSEVLSQKVDWVLYDRPEIDSIEKELN